MTIGRTGARRRALRKKNAACYAPCWKECLSRAARKGRKLSRSKRTAMANRCFNDCMTTGCDEYLWYREG